MLFNPTIESLAGEATEEEGCLSFPGITADVKRAARAVVTAEDIDGEPARIEAEDLLARALQHEIDHLDGILFIDYVSGLKRQLLRGKLRKLQQQFAVAKIRKVKQMSETNKYPDIDQKLDQLDKIIKILRKSYRRILWRSG